MDREAFYEATMRHEGEKFLAVIDALGEEEGMKTLDLVNELIVVLHPHPPGRANAAMKILTSGIQDGFKLLAKMKEENN